MEARIIQSLMAQNKKLLSVLNDEIKDAQEDAKYLFSIERECGARSFLKRKYKLEAKLAKLVGAQKALKAELQTLYKKEAEQRFYDSM